VGTLLRGGERRGSGDPPHFDCLRSQIVSTRLKPVALLRSVLNRSRETSQPMRIADCGWRRNMARSAL